MIVPSHLYFSKSCLCDYKSKINLQTNIFHISIPTLITSENKREEKKKQNKTTAPSSSRSLLFSLRCLYMYILEWADFFYFS